MSVFSVISSVLSYVFTTIIYLFIFSVIALIYMDIKKMSKKENESEKDNKKKRQAKEEKEKQERKDKPVPSSKRIAILRTVKSEKAKDAKMKAAYRFDGRGVIVGRGKDCDISISHMFLSVEHFQIWCDEGLWYISDMGSKNGTYLNGSKLRKIKNIEDGDEIAFGELEFVFEEEL